MMVLQILSLILWLVLVPFAVGLLPAGLLPQKKRSLGTVFLSGYLCWFALFELIGIPIVIGKVYHGYSTLVIVFAIVSLLLAALGVRYNHSLVKIKMEKDNFSWENAALWLLFFMVVAFQLYMSFTRASFDGDDSYYVVQGAIAQQTDTLYRINPNTGRSAPLDVRHALALIPIWEAFIGTLSGIHVTIVAHSVISFILLPLTYLTYFKIGQELFGEKKERLPVFMILMALFQMFGNVSIYTNETFLLTRTWQGKSLAGNLILPGVFWIFLCLFEKEAGKRSRREENGYWLLLAALNLAAGISSSLAVMLCTMLAAGLAFLFAVKERKLTILLKAALTCIPGGLYVLVYLIISH